MKLGEVVVNIEYNNFKKFHYILMKKIIVFYQTHLTDGRPLGAGEFGLGEVVVHIEYYDFTKFH